MVSFENMIHLFSGIFRCLLPYHSWGFQGFISGPHQGAHTRIASESNRYEVYIFLSKVHLEEKEEHKNYSRIAPTCFERNYTYERRKHTKTKAFCKNISCSFIFALIFLYFCSYGVI